MLTATDLTADGKLLADHLDAATSDGLAAALPAASGPHLAALAIIAGERGAQDAVAPLLGLLDRDGLAGKTVAWALGRLATADNGVEATLITALADGGLDVRENAYGALAGLAARGVHRKELADAMAARVQAEIDRAKSGGSGLGEHACRVLAILGDSRTPTLIQQVIDQDRFCDRFELQRLRKAVQDEGRDQETIKAVKAPWRTTFADALMVPKAPAAEKPVEKAPAPAKPAAPAAKAPAPTAPPVMSDTPPPAYDEGMEEVPPGEDDSMPGDPQPIDWKGFATSPEAEALAPQLKQLAGQLGPLLEQLSVRAIRAPLTDLNTQEFAALLLQVMPQALPPQHVQMALSPHAMQCYKALVKYLMRTGVAPKGQELLDAIALVRKELQNQIRQAGILNGPDYSDPDDKPAVAPKA